MSDIKLKEYIIQAAVDECLLSDYRIKMGAVIFNKKSIVSVGRNYSLKSVKKLHPQYQKYLGSVHAEVDSIIRAKKDLKGLSIFVVRLNRSSQFRFAKPCVECMKYIDHVGIKKVFYTIDHYPYIEYLKL